ncbi:MAG: T9SS type B sorting domain-containing protein [Croceitalea sp.]|nr:T9SS type B sorting domain-containing protein [Croceitalea sp.]
MFRHIIVLFSIFLIGSFGYAQVAQNCPPAVPICNNTPVNGGTTGYDIDDFNGATSTGCLELTTSGAIESNSAWYRFRTGASGQLGFNIGHETTEDWDFALYQSDDCDNLGEPVRCNFFDNRDEQAYTGVGEDPTGNSDSVHYDEWLQVEPGQDFYLLINNFSNVNSGFSIQFSGEIFNTNPNDALDCSIVNNLMGPPIAACEGDPIELDATTSDATGYNWYSDVGNGFQLIVGENNPTLQVNSDALYRVEVIRPSSTIISDVQVAFTVNPNTNPVSNEVFCHQEDMIYDLGQKDSEALGAQNPNSFVVSYHASQAEADNNNSPLPKQYPKNPGVEVFYVRTTSVANQNCYDASQTFEINALETPVLTFDEQVNLCDNSPSVLIGESMPNPNFTYLWNTGETTSSILATQSGNYALTATNSFNGVDCIATRTVTVNSSVLPQIDDVEIDDLQTSNTVTIITTIDGEFEYQLDNGAFQSSNVFEAVLPGAHTITMRDTYGCGDVTEEIVVVGFLNHFSPNGDGLNENWHIDGLSSLNDPVVTIYDRYGKLIKQLSEFTPGWDGTFNGLPLPSTDYWFKLSYVDNNGNRTYAKYLQNHFSLRR